MELSTKELDTVNNSEFIFIKNRIIKNIEEQLKLSKNRLVKHADIFDKILNQSGETIKSNISKGENYKGLPFVILDYPSIFKKDDIFAYRTMFWWGNYFSSTLHLQGKYLSKFRSKLLSNFNLLLNRDIYICINDTPWEYNFDKDNFIPLENNHIELLETNNFIKLSKKLPLEEYKSLSQFSNDYINHLILVLTK